MVVLFDDETIFTYVQSQGLLPSGMQLGMPTKDVLGRCASILDLTQDDINYLESFEGVQIMESMPSDWQEPPSEP